MRLLGVLRSSLRHANIRPFRNVPVIQRRCFQNDFVSSDPNAKRKQYTYPEVYNPYGLRPPPSDKIVQLADLISSLPPEERAQIGPTLQDKLDHPKLQQVSSEDMEMGGGNGGGTDGAKKEDKKVEKTAFDVKLDKFDPSAKIKVIKEVRAFTSLGLKEAKELVEKSPVILKRGLTKEEATDIIDKIKVAGGVAVME